MGRITLEMTVMDAALEMAGGNPGAITVLAKIMQNHPIGILIFCHLDDAEIYGSDIWVGYKDVCGCGIEKFIQMAQGRRLKDAIKGMV